VTSELPRDRSKLPAKLAVRIYQLHLRISGNGPKRALWSRRFTVADRAKCESTGVCLASNTDILDMWRIARGTESFHESVVEVAHALGYIKDPTRDRMLAALADHHTQSTPAKPRARPKPTTANPGTEPKPSSGAVPHWDHEARELRYRGRVVRTVMRPRLARNIVAILRAFEKAGWPSRIADPLKRQSSDETRRRDVHNLNNKLDRTLMFFACDGDGTGFLWKKAPRVKSKKAAKRPRQRRKPA